MGHLKVTSLLKSYSRELPWNDHWLLQRIKDPKRPAVRIRIGRVLTFWAREVTIIAGATRAIMTRWTECCINNSCIGSITVITCRTSFARAFAGLVLEGTIFTSDWLRCSNFAEVTCCTEVLSWCGCALSTRAVIVSSAFVRWCKISRTSTEAPRSTIPTIRKFRILYCVGEFSLGARHWNSRSWWTIVTDWTIKLIWYSWTVITVIASSTVPYGFSQCRVRTILTKFTRERTRRAPGTKITSWTYVTWKKIWIGG